MQSAQNVGDMMFDIRELDGIAAGLIVEIVILFSDDQNTLAAAAFNGFDDELLISVEHVFELFDVVLVVQGP